MMDYRRLAMSKHQMTYQEAERQAEMMNQITIVHHSAVDFLDTPDNRVNESIDTYKKLLEEYSDEVFVPSIVEEFCKRVYEDDEHFIFFKPFCMYMLMRCSGINRARLNITSFVCSFKNLVGWTAVAHLSTVRGSKCTSCQCEKWWTFINNR